MPWLIHEQLRKHTLELLDGDTNIGGGITALTLPGHTPGSMGVSFKNQEGTVVLAGDAIKSLSEVLAEVQSTVGHRFAVANSPEHDRESIRKVKAVADRIVPGHFSELRRLGDVFVRPARRPCPWSSHSGRSRRRPRLRLRNTR